MILELETQMPVKLLFQTTISILQKQIVYCTCMDFDNQMNYYFFYQIIVINPSYKKLL